MRTQFPKCLRRKLIFGDREQINALKALETETQEKHKGLKQFRVYLDLEAVIHDKFIYTKSAEDAEQEAKLHIDIDDFHIYLSAKATEVKSI